MKTTYNLNSILKRFESPKQREITTQELQIEINLLKLEIDQIKEHIKDSNKRTIKGDIEILNQISMQNWYIKITLIIKNEFRLNTIVLIDSGAYLNCIHKELIPTNNFEKTNENLRTASSSILNIDYQLTDVKICNNNIDIQTVFILVKT